MRRDTGHRRDMSHHCPGTRDTRDKGLQTLSRCPARPNVSDALMLKFRILTSGNGRGIAGTTRSKFFVGRTIDADRLGDGGNG